MNALMVAFAFAMPYHVMRCAAAVGASVSVLGNGSAALLRHSRHCRQFHRSRFDPRSADYEVVTDEIAQLVQAHGIDIVFPVDDVSTRLLIAVRDRLGIHTTPLPSLEQFDTLNDKWNFCRFCLAHGVRVPAMSLYQRREQLLADIESGWVSLPLTVKPTDQSAGRGVIHVTRPEQLSLIGRADYTPLLVQQHIVGQTVSVSVLCRHGKVVARNLQYRDGLQYRLIQHADLWDNVERLVRAIGMHGPANLDAVLDARSGQAYIVECNPRFWYSIYMCAMAGLNFVDLSLRFDQLSETATYSQDEGQLRLAWLPSLVAPWRLNPAERRLLGYRLNDPVPYLIERFHLFDDTVAVDHRLMDGTAWLRNRTSGVSSSQHTMRRSG